MKSLVIIPAYNEEKSILNTVADIKKNAPDFDYIIINDCSQDKTLQLCKDAGIPVINLPINLGIGGAVQTGYLYGHRFGYDYAIQINSGLSMDDKIAFPYSKSIKEGMKTKEGSLDTFMGYDSTSYGGLG